MSILGREFYYSVDLRDINMIEEDLYQINPKQMYKTINTVYLDKLKFVYVLGGNLSENRTSGLPIKIINKSRNQVIPIAILRKLKDGMYELSIPQRKTAIYSTH